MPKLRNPNGYGTVFKLSGRRRKPFIARKTVGYDDRAFPIYSVIGYYATRAEAMLALAEYNASPYDLDLSRITFADLYDRWSTETFPALKPSSVYAHKAAYKFCADLYAMPYKSIRRTHMQRCIDNCGKSYATQSNIRNLFASLDRYAYDLDIIEKCYSQNLTTGEKETKPRSIFTDEEVARLWKKRPESDEILFLLYTGCRISEMLDMRCVDVDLEAGIMTGGTKTAAGKNRIIPIHPEILPVIKDHLSDGKYLFYIDYDRFRSKDEAVSRNSAYRKRYAALMDELKMHHIPHECRHTFRSKLDSAGANKACIDLIMGHKSPDVGERVYTHKTISELQEAVKKLSYALSVSAR